MGPPFPKINKRSKRELVGVYLPNCTAAERYRFTRPYARQLRAQGLANFINRANDIRLTFTPVMEFRGESCTMNPALMLRAVDGNIYAMEAVGAWR